MKKLKDLIYDYNDIFLAIIIIIIAGAVIFWKVSDIMAYPSFAKNKGTTTTGVDMSGVDLTQNPVDPIVAPGSDISTGGDTENSGETGTGGSGETSGSGSGTAGNTGNGTTGGSGETAGGGSGTAGNTGGATGGGSESGYGVKKDTKFTVPSGYVCSKIADKLQNEKLCSSDDFKAAAKELNAESKLRAGDFNIPAGSTAKDIVKIIANIK